MLFLVIKRWSVIISVSESLFIHHSVLLIVTPCTAAMALLLEHFQEKINPGNLSGKKAILTQAVGTSTLTKSAFRTMVPCSIAKITLIHSIDWTQQDISLTCKTQLRYVKISHREKKRLKKTAECFLEVPATWRC